MSEITLDIKNKNYFDGRMNNWYVLGPSSLFLFLFLQIAALKFFTCDTACIHIASLSRQGKVSV